MTAPAILTPDPWEADDYGPETGYGPDLEQRRQGWLRWLRLLEVETEARERAVRIVGRTMSTAHPFIQLEAVPVVKALLVPKIMAREVRTGRCLADDVFSGRV